MKVIIRHIITDLLTLAVLAALTILISKDVFGIRLRGWYPSDFLTIGYPRTLPETVPMKPALIWVLGGPILMLIIFWIFVDRVFSSTFDGHTIESEPLLESDLVQLYNQKDDVSYERLLPSSPPSESSQSGLPKDETPIASIEAIDTLQSTYPTTPVTTPPVKETTSPARYSINWGTVVIPGQSVRVRKWRFVAYQLYTFLFVILLSLFITNSIKNIVGSLRPDFLSCCQPDYSHPDIVIGPNGWIDHKYEQLICKGSAHEVLEAHKSFPSGHSSSAMVASLYIAIYLFKRFWNRGQRNGIGYGILAGQTLTPFLIVLSMAVAFCIAATRHIDNRHRFADISIGLIIGGCCALVSLVLGGFTPSYECDGSIVTERQRANNNNPHLAGVTNKK